METEKYYKNGNEAMVDLEDHTGLKFEWRQTGGLHQEHLILVESEEIEKLVNHLKRIEDFFGLAKMRDFQNFYKVTQ